MRTKSNEQLDEMHVVNLPALEARKAYYVFTAQFLANSNQQCR